MATGGGGGGGGANSINCSLLDQNETWKYTKVKVQSISEKNTESVKVIKCFITPKHFF